MEIEKGIPKPIEFKGFSHSRSKYPFAEMDVGDSVFFPNHGAEGPAKWAATKAGKRNGRKFVFRTMDGGLRVWRDE